ncbi:hypothetical protein MC7420_2503 [Coleofasciculus chthonoplastes PCC 7420]|uniref:Uncharacterized protein n=1 Tax=Coleofasciculus chthonoplastes PCC 7420 TaxID=118168 RepID=B4VZQ3_9CYAN|nr:hypothetical protein MC7420_2503 [Coleofasciculus chthonoplastes PCC 7420]
MRSRLGEVEGRECDRLWVRLKGKVRSPLGEVEGRECHSRLGEVEGRKECDALINYVIIKATT